MRNVGQWQRDSHQGQPTPFNSEEDLVLGLHPLPEIEASALKRSGGGESLALRCQWESQDEGGKNSQGSSCYICFGRVTAAYPAGFASQVIAFIRLEDLTGMSRLCRPLYIQPAS